MASYFPQGVVIFFRTLTADGSLARSVHLAGRDYYISTENDYVVTDIEGRFLGAYPRDFVSAILPLDTVGPGNADNPPNRT